MCDHPSVPAMDRFTDSRWAEIGEALDARRRVVPDAVLGLLRSLSGLVEGFPVDQLTHACQTAARAQCAGAPPEVVVAALCHDVGKAISWDNHAAISAEILRPHVSDEVYRVVLFHQDFQARHLGGHGSGGPDARERFRGEAWFDLAETFVDEWDRRSFDPGYDTPDLAHFEPLLREVIHPGR